MSSQKMEGFSISGTAAPLTSVRAVKTAPTLSTRQPLEDCGPQPVSMQRARVWSVEVENAYRYQLAGFKDSNEYLLVHPDPELWDSGMVKCLRAKSTGYYMYFRQTRECEEKHLNKVKLYEY
jgi:Meiosis-expressed